MKTLVFLEHHTAIAREAVAGASSPGPRRSATWRGWWQARTCAELAAEAGAFGASTVFVADDARLGTPLPQPRVDVLAGLVRDGGFDTVLLAQSVLAADIAAALAIRLERGPQLGSRRPRARKTESSSARGPALADSRLGRRGVELGRSVWRCSGTGAFDPVEGGGTAEVRDVVFTLEEHSLLAELVEPAVDEASGPSIEDADVVVAGGRGLGAPEGFALVEELAAALGGAVGATRAVVDAGWYPYSAQVGQTGKTVSPKLYVALGISGAIQHKVGMQGSGTIVAINKDPNAPIFDYADLGVVGDLNQIVPKLAELVRQRKSS